MRVGCRWKQVAVAPASRRGTAPWRSREGAGPAPRAGSGLESRWGGQGGRPREPLGTWHGQDRNGAASNMGGGRSAIMSRPSGDSVAAGQKGRAWCPTSRGVRNVRFRGLADSHRVAVSSRQTTGPASRGLPLIRTPTVRIKRSGAQSVEYGLRGDPGRVVASLSADRPGTAAHVNR